LAHKVLAIAGSPRRHGNTETLLDQAIKGITEADREAEGTKIILNERTIKPCQSCGFCTKKGYCRFAESDDMGPIFEALEVSDRFIIAAPIFFANVSAQLKAMIDRCQAIWARKYLLDRPHPNPDRRALFLCCGGFKHDRFFTCARQVIEAWCNVLDIKLSETLFYAGIDARHDIETHSTALAEAAAAGRTLVSPD